MDQQIVFENVIRTKCLDLNIPQREVNLTGCHRRADWLRKQDDIMRDVVLVRKFAFH
jgi:hypothetical protein